jgi:PA14 domain
MKPVKNTCVCLTVLCLAVGGHLASAGGSEPGLVGEYFDFGTTSVEDFPKLEPNRKPTLKRVDKMISFRSTGPTFPGTQLTNRFAIRWTGKLKALADGEYTFSLESDDGSRLFIDGKLVVDNGGLHDMQSQWANVELKAGEHDIRVDYFENENDGGAGCVLSWKPPGHGWSEVSPKALSHKPEPK